MKFKDRFTCSRMSADNRLSLILLSHFLDIFRSITIVNKTGENVTDLSLKERIGSKKQALDNGKLADGQEITVTGEIAVDNGAPSLDFTYALESGNSMMTTITTKGDKIITLKVDADGSPVADIAEK